MKAETKIRIKMKANRFKEKVKENLWWVVPIFGVATTGAAWKGYTNSVRNQRLLDQTIDVVNHNAKCGNQVAGRVSDLERQTNALFEKALKETSGEEGTE